MCTEKTQHCMVIAFLNNNTVCNKHNSSSDNNNSSFVMFFVVIANIGRGDIPLALQITCFV